MTHTAIEEWKRSLEYYKRNPRVSALLQREFRPMPEPDLMELCARLEKSLNKRGLTHGF